VPTPIETLLDPFAKFNVCTQLLSLVTKSAVVPINTFAPAKDPEVKFSVPPAPSFFFPSHSTITDASPAVTPGAEGSSGFIADCPDL
jgi:hypothetical protein